MVMRRMVYRPGGGKLSGLAKYRHLWKPVQKAMQGTDSTTEMTTVDPDQVYMVVMKKISEKTGVYVSWPSNR